MGRVKRFFQSESAGGIMLVAAAAIAMIVANSPFAKGYSDALEVKVEVLFGGIGLSKPLILWINDALMAIFFLLVGLELKKELLVGDLSNKKQVILPLAAALGGVAAPAGIYYLLNKDAGGANMNGWAIPAATDIAFAVGILAMLGDRVPRSLKTFLLSLAVFDDLVAIIIIALFYTAKLNFIALGLSAVGITGLFLLNRRGVMKVTPYLMVGLFLWVCVLKSGVHATIAGVVTGLFVPLSMRHSAAAASSHDHGHDHHAPLERMQHSLHPWVAFVILPIFAFANAGVSLSGIGFGTFIDPITAGIAGGLVLGKPIGIMAMVFLCTALGIAAMPKGACTKSLFGVSIVAGIGFTMSLFIGNLAFKETWGVMGVYVRLGVLTASVLAAGLGYYCLNRWLPASSKMGSELAPAAELVPESAPAEAPALVRPSVRAPIPVESGEPRNPEPLER